MAHNASSPSPATGEKPQVLVVDDEYGPRESIAFTLSTDFEVDTASRAAEALRKMKVKPYAAVVLDIRMPEMDGIRALEEIRKIDTDVSVIMLTGYGTLLTAQQAMVAGANQYLRKPPDVEELQEAVRKQVAATRLRRQQTRMNREMQERNAALKHEIEQAEPHIWQSRASVELVHDLNNPLTVVIGYAGLLSEEARAVAAVDATRSQKLLEYANVVEKAAEYCHHLAENWRQSARKHAEFERVDLVAVAEEVRQVIFFGNSSIVLTGLPQAVVRGSKFELMRIFQNLFKNALEAGANTLTMQVKQAGDSFELGLSDDGSGMAPDAVKKALRGGFSSKASGTGLGLSICRHLLGTHGATLQVDSTPGKGTVIRMVFPAAKA
ncbi:MAG: hybrid sensor histidine kinase/response regulator [Opitutaceae bacterium]|nr:hybrid sensor histidine kinase/response regulator [Opitutaceae bacterium]